MAERLQKILSRWGVASRRQAEKLILEGRVRLNGSPAHLGQQADPNVDAIEVDGTLIRPAYRPAPVYLLLHKPAGVVSTCSDPQGRTTVLDLLPDAYRQGQGIHPVGRLDADSTGALLLTNDGDLTQQLTHPRHHVAKTYHVGVQGHPSEAELRLWRQGVLLDGYQTQPAQVRVLRSRRQSNQTELEVILREGRNRQIRRIAEQLGHPVVWLHRVAIGPVRLQQLAAGNVRPLTEAEIQGLKQDASAVGSPALKLQAHSP